VTYLNLDCFSGQLTKTSSVSQAPKAMNVPIISSTSRDQKGALAMQIPSLLIRESLPVQNLASDIARRILKSRRIPKYDVSRELEKVGGFTAGPQTGLYPLDALLRYAQENWLHHVTLFDQPLDQNVETLFERMLCGQTRMVESPCKCDDLSNINPSFLDLVVRSQHQILVKHVIKTLLERAPESLPGMEKVLQRLPDRRTVGYDARAWDYSPYTSALQEAINSSQGTAVGLLFKKFGPDFFLNSNIGTRDFLIHAITIDNTKIVQLLIDNGADVNSLSINDEYETPLHCAVSDVRGEAVTRVLLKNGAKVNVESEHPGLRVREPILHRAVRCGAEVSVIKLLLENGANPNLNGAMRETVLQTAKRIRQRDENPVWNRMAGIMKLLELYGARG